VTAAVDISPYAHAFAAAGSPDDRAPASPTLREQARLYQAAGFRTLRARPNKTPAEPKDYFARAKPNAKRRYQEFPEHRTGGVIILCGALSYGGDRELLGLDRDGEMTWAQLEAELGCALPPTLSSKGDRHRLYWLPAGHGIRQGNGTLKCEGGAVDIRPDHGGYLFEPWQWDDGFDAERIADFPDVEALRRVRGGAAPSTSDAPAGAGAPDLPEPRQITEDEYEQLLTAACNAFPAGGGGTGLHDACKAFGGGCRRAGVAKGQVFDLAFAVAQTVGSELPRTRAAGAVDAWDRCHRGESAFGVPRLRELCGEGAETEALIGALRELTPKDQWVEMMAEQWKQRGANDTTESEPAAAPADGFWSFDFEGLSKSPPMLCSKLGIVDEGGRVNAIVGAAGGGKTWSAMALALAVATSTKVFGAFECKAGVVRHIDSDMSAKTTKRRYLKLARGMGLSAELAAAIRDKRLGVMGPYVFTAGGQLDDKKFARLQAELRGVKLLVVDSLRRIAPGIDENSAAFSSVLAKLRDVSAATDTVILMLHHTGKSLTSKAGMGTSALAGEWAAWWVLEDGEWTMHKKHGDVDDLCEPFTTTFQKTGTPAEQASPDGGGVVLRVVGVEESSDDACAQVARFVASYGFEGCSAREAEDQHKALGVTRNGVRRAIRTLLGEGALYRDIGPKGTASAVMKLSDAGIKKYVKSEG
jgi:hypothetical protein